jgi:hypothetical protein
MKATKKNLLRLASKLGLEVDENHSLSTMGFDISFYAPDGKCFSYEPGLHVIVASQWDDETRAECIQDAIDRLNYGLQDCECDYCHESEV